MRASAGASLSQRLRESASSALAVPSTSISTPAEVLRTQPARPRRLGQPIDKRPETDPLDDPANVDSERPAGSSVYTSNNNAARSEPALRCLEPAT